MTRRPKARRSIGVFYRDCSPVRVWYDMRQAAICFKRHRSRKTIQIPLTDLFDRLTGQITMPFV